MADWRQVVESADREWAIGQIDQAVRMLRSAVPDAEREGDAAALGSLLHNLGLALDQAGEGLQARDVLQRAGELLSSSPDGEPYLGDTLRLLGMVEVELGDIGAGVSHVEQAISHHQARGDTDGATRAHVDLGIALKDAGQLSEAEAHLAAALTAARQADFEKVMAHALTGLGLVAEKLERPSQARAHYLEALKLYRKLSDQDNAATIIYNIAALQDASGERDEAVRGLDEALALDMQFGDVRGAADCRASLASIEISRGNPARAEALHLEALAFYRSGGYRRRAIHSLVDLAAIARDGSRFAEAEAFLAEALRLAAELADPLEVHDVQLHWGDLRFKSGDRPGARAHYAKAAGAMKQARELLVRERDALSYFGEDRVECIDRLIVLASADDPQECVEWVERAKGQELVRRLAGVPLPLPRHAPAPLVLAQQQAAEQVRRLSAQLSSEAPATPNLLAAYIAAQDALRSANGTLGQFDPEWATLRLGDAPSWADLQLLLSRLAAEDPGRGVVVVHYYLRETTAAMIGLLPGRDPELVSVAMHLAPDHASRRAYRPGAVVAAGRPHTAGDPGAGRQRAASGARERQRRGRERPGPAAGGHSQHAMGALPAPERRKGGVGAGRGIITAVQDSVGCAMLGRRWSQGAVCHDTTGRIVGDLERRFRLLMTENTPEVAYYYPATFWAARENGWIKSLLLFFDQVAILLPAYMYDRHKMADPTLSGPLEDQGLLRILDPKTWVDQAMAEKVASTVIDLLAAGVFDVLPEAHHFAELSKSRIGYSADISLASWLVDELEQKGLARPSQDGVSIPLHPVVRTTILVLLAQLARLHGIDEGLSINPTTNMASVVGDLLRLLSHENLPSAANIVTLDLEPITLDLETVPLDEVLDYRKENHGAHQAYMRDVRRFALDLACADDAASRETLFQKRRAELSEAIRELRTTARRAFGKNLSAWSFGLAGSWWSLKHGDPIGLTLAALPALTAAAPDSQIVGAYSYLFEAQHEFG